MNIREQLHKTRHGPICNFGGSDSTSTNQTTQNYDQRQVNTTSNYDLSNRSTSNLYDTSAKNSNNTTITTDGGAITGALTLARSAIEQAGANGVHAYDYADNIFSSALDFANMNDGRALSAFDRAATIQGDALHAVSAAAGQLQSAYADAKGTSASNKTIILALLAVAAVVAVAAMRK